MAKRQIIFIRDMSNYELVDIEYHRECMGAWACCIFNALLIHKSDVYCPIKMTALYSDERKYSDRLNAMISVKKLISIRTEPANSDYLITADAIQKAENLLEPILDQLLADEIDIIWINPSSVVGVIPEAYYG